MEKHVIGILWWTLGGSMTGASLLKLLNTPIAQELFKNMPLGFQYCIFSFTTIWLFLNCLIVWEGYRKRKIQNDEAEMALRDKKREFGEREYGKRK